MRVLQVVQKPQRRGAEVFAYQLSRELRRQGCEVQTVYLYPHAGAGALPVEPPDQLLNGRESHPYETFPGVHWSLLRRLLHVVDAYAPDIVQVNGSRTVKYGAFAARLRPHRGWALVYRNIGNPQDWVRTPFHYHYYRRWIMPRVDGVVGVSQATLENVRSFYRLSVPMIQILPGVDPAALAPTTSRMDVRRRTGTSPASPVIVYVGSLTPEKRLDRLLRLGAALLPSFPDLRVWLVGGGAQQGLLKDQARLLGLTDTVRFLGVQTNVADYLQAADLFVLTSDTEGIPAVLLEAGSMGLAVVATRVGGVGECVIDGETGRLVEPQDEAGLAAAAGHLLRDSTLRARMGASAGRWISGHFTIDKVAARYKEFYITLSSDSR